jgi:hypothetical protein
VEEEAGPLCQLVEVLARIKTENPISAQTGRIVMFGSANILAILPSSSCSDWPSVQPAVWQSGSKRYDAAPMCSLEGQ